MTEKLEVGMRLQAKSAANDKFYAAEVMAVATGKKRSKAPVKVHYVGWDGEDTWLPIEDLKSKALPKAKRDVKKAFDYSGLQNGMKLQAESDGKYYAAEVVTVATARNRANAPVKVHWVGYTDASDEWVGGDRLKSKALTISDKADTTAKAKARDKVKGKPWPASTTDIRSASWASPGVKVDTVGVGGGGRRVKLVSRPIGDFKDSDFKVEEEPVPEPKDGEAVVKVIFISCDPTHRIWASEAEQYMPCVGLGTVMRAGAIGKVVKTSDPKSMPEGSYVSGMGGVQEYFVAPIATLNPVVPNFPLSYNHSIFSAVIGLTAWVGTNICEPKAGETMVVSGAAGGVGSVAAQLAKLRGAKVIGIAGGKEKCAWLKDVANLDGAIDYKNEDIGEQLDKLCPEGVDGYFDNVGGSTLETVLLKMRNFGRIAFCGSISGYNSNEGQVMRVTNYQMILFRRLKVQGFICVDHVADIGTCFEELIPAVAQGKIKFKEDIQEVDIAEYPRIVRKLYTGENTGKLMMKICSE